MKRYTKRPPRRYIDLLRALHAETPDRDVLRRQLEIAVRFGETDRARELTRQLAGAPTSAPPSTSQDAHGVTS